MVGSGFVQGLLGGRHRCMGFGKVSIRDDLNESE